MTVRIRLARFGRTHRPFYRVVVTDSRTKRDGKHLEVLGFYNPLADICKEARIGESGVRILSSLQYWRGKDDVKRMALQFERLKYWLSVGAQPSETVESLLSRAGLLPVDAVTGGTPNQEQPANVSQNVDNGISPEAIFSIGLQVD